MVDTIDHLLADAEKLCGPAGLTFEDFKKTYCPELGRSRTYEVLAIQDGRKTIEEIRAATRKRVAKHRANVTDKPSVTSDPAESEDTGTGPEATGEPGARVSTGSAERSVEDVKAAGAAFAGEEATAATEGNGAGRNEADGDGAQAAEAPDDTPEAVGKLYLFNQIILGEFLASKNQQQVARDILEMVGCDVAENLRDALSNVVSDYNTAVVQAEDEFDEQELAAEEERLGAAVVETEAAWIKAMRQADAKPNGKTEEAAEKKARIAKAVADEAKTAVWIFEKAAKLRAEKGAAA